jgi:hypothetical protein
LVCVNYVGRTRAQAQAGAQAGEEKGGTGRGSLNSGL